MFILDVPSCHHFNMFYGETSVVSLVGIYTGRGVIFARRALDAVQYFSPAVYSCVFPAE